MNQVSISLSHGRQNYSPGERISGTVQWTLSEIPSSVELRLFWYTEGKGDQDVGIVERKVLSSVQQSSSEFEFVVPDGPYSFSGTLISLSWALELVCEGADAVARETLVVSPSGAEVNLGAAD